MIMNILRLLFSEFQNRWQIIKKCDSSTGKKIFAALEIFCFPVSMLSILLLFCQVAMFCCGLGDMIPVWWIDYVSPVLLSGAIGYLTNWLAIMMLFRPYEPTTWLFLWPQGMIPRNKPNIAKSLGHEVGYNLLPPEKLVLELSEKISSFLKSPIIILEIKSKIQNFLLQNQNSIIQFLIPEIEKTLVSAIDRLITSDNIKSFWTVELQPRLNSEETRSQIAAYIVKLGQEHSGNLTSIIRQKLESHLTQKLQGFPGGGVIVGLVMDFFADPQSMKKMIEDWLGDAETQKTLQEKMLLIGKKIDDWMKSEEAGAKLGDFAENSKQALKKFLANYLYDALPVFAQNALESETLWKWFEEKFIPNTRENLLLFIKEHEQDIINALQLDKRIENAINAQDVKKFHNMINNIAAEHLGAIQVLGYVLGVLIGGLQLIQALIF